MLGIRAIPHLDEKIAALLRKYGSEDIEDVECEEADLEEAELFAEPTDEPET